MGWLSAIKAVATLANMLAGIWRDRELRSQGRREAEIDNLRASMQAMKNDYEIDSENYSLDSIAKRLRAREQNADDISVSGPGVSDNVDLGEAHTSRR